MGPPPTGRPESGEAKRADRCVRYVCRRPDGAVVFREANADRGRRTVSLNATRFEDHYRRCPHRHSAEVIMMSRW
jgi:hypothetical protein